jgi:hypothetical protein
VEGLTEEKGKRGLATTASVPRSESAMIGARRPVSPQLFAASLISVAVIACSGNARAGNASNTAVPSVQERSLGAGIACFIDGRQFGPVSFAVRDVGRPGVPRLLPNDYATLRQIEQYVHSRVLRFTYVETPKPEFIVYNAKLGPCTTIIPGYEILNKSCNEAWAPTQGLGAAPDCLNPRRPWMPNDRGGTGSARLWVDGTAY